MRDQLLPEEISEEGQRQHNLITRAVDHPEMVAHELFSARTLIRVAAMSGDSESSPDDPAASALEPRRMQKSHVTAVVGESRNRCGWRVT